MADLQENLELFPVNRKKGVALVLVAGIFWSFAGLAIRLIEHALEWQILFYRSSTLVIFLVCYIAVARRGTIIASFRSAGKLSVLAGFCLSIAFATWIFSLTHTTVANALFLLSTAPFLAALIGRWLLGEIVRPSTWIFILMASAGVGVMVIEGLQIGTFFGTCMALASATGFAFFAVLLRRGRNTDLVTFVFWAGVLAVIWATSMILITGEDWNISIRDWLLCAFMGVFQIGIGLVMFSHGSRHLSAAEITLLSMTEIILGPIWVYIGVGELPGVLTLVGGGVVLSAIAGQAIRTLRQAG